MAKDKSIDQAIDELLKDYKTAVITAAKYTTKKIGKEIYERSLQLLEKYYNNYTAYTREPRSYERTYRLKESFVPFATISSYKDYIKCSMGVRYDYTRLDGYYYGSKKYQPTDSEWIVNNYLDGIHPTTNGSRFSKDFMGPLSDGQSVVEYIPIKDTYSPTVLMEAYLDVCKNEFDGYMMISLMDQVLRK